MFDISVLEDTSVDVASGDHEKQKHYVFPVHAVVEAMVTGEEIEALCGKKWVPMNHGESFPICQTCEDKFKDLAKESYD